MGPVIVEVSSMMSIKQSICENAYRHMSWIREKVKRIGQ